MVEYVTDHCHKMLYKKQFFSTEHVERCVGLIRNISVSDEHLNGTAHSDATLGHPGSPGEESRILLRLFEVNTLDVSGTAISEFLKKPEAF